MVKKSSFLDKLKNRLRHSDVQVETHGRGGSASGAPTRAPAQNPADTRGTARPVTPERPRFESAPAVREPEVVQGRKMSQKEEATVAIQDGFKELTSLLRGMQNRVEDQGERFAHAADGITRLPALQEAQLDVLRQLAERLDQQDQRNSVVVQTLGDLPELMGHVRKALDRAAATDERTAGTLDEFRSNMDRIQGSMEQMVDHSRQHADAATSLSTGRDAEIRGLAEDLTSQQKDVTQQAVSRLEATQRDSARSLRDAQADHATRLGKLVEDGTRTNRAVLVLLVLVVLALATIAGLLATR